MEPLVLESSAATRGARRDVGVVVTTWNRPRLAARTLASVARSDLRGAALVIVDDCSDDPRTLRLVRRFDVPGVPVLKVLKRARTGFKVRESLRIGWDLARARFGCRLLVNLDADAVVRPAWLTRLQALHARERERGQLIVTGFNARQHPTLATHADHRVKASLGGINLCFDAALYEALVRPNLAPGPWGWDWRLVEAARTEGVRLLCARPSVVQHLGLVGWWSGPGHMADFAADYWGATPARETLVWGVYRAAHAGWRAAHRARAAARRALDRAAPWRPRG